MALIDYRDITQHTSLALWRIEEDEQYFLNRLQLTKEDSQIIASIKAKRRYLEWLASRYLIRYMLQPSEPIHLTYTTNNCPQLLNLPFSLSISHSKDVVAVIISRSNQVGIDVEYIHPKVQRVADKFMSDDEMKNMPENKKDEFLILHWSAKETLFKYYGEGDLSFKEQLLLVDVPNGDKGRVKGLIRAVVEHLIPVNYEVMNQEFVLTYSFTE